MRKLLRAEIVEELRETILTIQRTMVDPLSESDSKESERYKGWLQASHFALMELNHILERS